MPVYPCEAIISTYGSTFSLLPEIHAPPWIQTTVVRGCTAPAGAYRSKVVSDEPPDSYGTFIRSRSPLVGAYFSIVCTVWCALISKTVRISSALGHGLTNANTVPIASTMTTHPHAMTA